MILLRHAKSDWPAGEVDINRPLAGRGRRQAPEAGRWLNASVGRIDLALVSPARRARSTWDIASAEIDVPPPTEIDARLYAASPQQILDVVRELADDLHTVILVGHNPGMEDLASLLAGERVPMPTSALAEFALSGRWPEADASSATLRASGRPPAT
jgi:phosphohistidine phosphatase